MTDFNQRAAVGQAYNNAQNDDRQVDRMNDMAYTVERFLFHLELAKLFQAAKPGDLETVIGNPKYIQLIRELQK